jgi:hypothetical protein
VAAIGSEPVVSALCVVWQPAVAAATAARRAAAATRRAERMVVLPVERISIAAKKGTVAPGAPSPQGWSAIER